MNLHQWPQHALKSLFDLDENGEKLELIFSWRPRNLRTTINNSQEIHCDTTLVDMANKVRLVSAFDEFIFAAELLPLKSSVNFVNKTRPLLFCCYSDCKCTCTCK